MNKKVLKIWGRLFLPLLFSFNCALSQITINFAYENFKYKAVLNPDFVKSIKIDTMKHPQLNIASMGVGLLIHRKLWRLSLSLNLGYNPRDHEDIQIYTTFPELNIELGPKSLALLLGIRKQTWFGMKIPGYPKDASLVYPKNIIVYQPFIGISTGIDDGKYILILSAVICLNFYSKNKLTKFSQDVIPAFNYIQLPKNSIKITISVSEFNSRKK